VSVFTRWPCATALDQWLTVGEVAAWLKVSKHWVYEYTRARAVAPAERLPHIKIGKHLRRSRASLHLEILALRHQLTVVNRSRGWRSAVHIVRPESVVAWHRRGFRLFWTWKRRQRTGRPGVPADVRALIRELSTANPLWGAPQIHGELQKLGVAVSQSTVAKFMRRHPRPRSQAWRTFLTNHASQNVAADLFVVPTVTFRLLFVLVILGHDRRRIVHAAVIDHPTAAWIAQQLRNAFPDDQARRSPA